MWLDIDMAEGGRVGSQRAPTYYGRDDPPTRSPLLSPPKSLVRCCSVGRVVVVLLSSKVGGCRCPTGMAGLSVRSRYSGALANERCRSKVLSAAESLYARQLARNIHGVRTVFLDSCLMVNTNLILSAGPTLRLYALGIDIHKQGQPVPLGTYMILSTLTNTRPWVRLSREPGARTC